MRELKLYVAQLIKGLDIGGLHGGAEIFSLNLARALAQKGVNVRLFIFYQMDTPAEQHYLDQMKPCNIEVVFLQRWQGKTSLASYFAGFKSLYRVLKQSPVDILHSHFSMGTAIAILLKIAGAIPYVVRTAHLDREWDHGWDGPLQQLLIRFFMFFLFPLAVDRECGVSSAVVSTLNHRWISRIINKKAQVIYNATDFSSPPEENDMARSEETRKTKNRFVIGTIGRMTEQKGHQFLLEAAPEVISQLPDAEFWLVGDGPLKEALVDNAHKLKLDTHVHFLGTRRDVADLLRQMDLFVLPSTFEGLPTVVMEAMACRLPVIGTNIPGTNEIIRNGKNGWLVPTRDPHALAETILKAAHDPGACHQVAEAALEGLQAFSIERIAGQYLNLYEELL